MADEQGADAPAPYVSAFDAAIPPASDASASDAAVSGSTVIVDAENSDTEVQDKELPYEEGPEEDKGGGGEDSDECINKVTTQQQIKIKHAKGIHEKGKKKTKAAEGNTIDIRQASFNDATGVPRFLNTDSLDPIKPYDEEKVINIIEDVMIQAFEAFIGHKLAKEGSLTDTEYWLPYNPDLCAKQASWAADAIRDKLKVLEFRKYKFIVIVTIGEKDNQNVYCCYYNKFDFERDYPPTVILENDVVFGCAIVLAIYYE